MDYKINLSDKIKLSDSVDIFKKAKIYYKKHPWILALNIILIVVGAFVTPVISVLIGLFAIFIIPSWKEKKST